ncbi:helix-turn-helix domain-containing protein [Kitasatospora sp. NPDC052896]|uniref:helix-turn-helix domain-containing protein n=1 Tax=Kitasatospora sp. NPDC052896 TaxID=3364061 RepID=UPI0037C50D04
MRDEPGMSVAGTAALSSSARELYLSIIRSDGRIDPATATVPEKIYLDELIQIGLLVVDLDDPGQLVAVDPKHLATRLSTDWQQQALGMLSRAISLPAELQDLADAFHSPSQGGGTIEYVRGKALINQKLRHAVVKAKEEVLAAQPGGPRPPEQLAGSMASDLQDLRRGVAARTIYHASTRYHGPTRDYVATVTQAGGEFRTLDEPYTRLIVVDRALAVIPVANDMSLAAFIRDRAVVTCLTEDVFERNWRRALVFDGGRSVPQQVVSQLRKTIVDLLLDGTNHRVIARRLGISERTLARHIAELREEYNVESLFQLGYAIARSSDPPGTPNNS